MNRIPIVIRPFFWIVSLILSFLLSRGDFVHLLIWEAIILSSVLFHEWGHALMAQLFKQKCRIELVAMGGLTFFEGPKLSAWKLFLITLNGPLFGFLLGFLAYLGYFIWGADSPMMGHVLLQIQGINWLWSMVNLLPILPLDGGQLVRIILEKFFPTKGISWAFFCSMVIAAFFSLYLFLCSNFIFGALFFLFAYDSFEGFRRTRNLKNSDRNEEIKTALLQAEMLMQQGEKEKAFALFERIKKEAKEGVLFDLATQYLAFLNYEDGKKEESYSLLKEIKSSLSPEGLCLLHQVAFDQNDHLLVKELSGEVFKLRQTADVALKNATALARLGENEAVLGWLESSLECGALNLKELIQDSAFDGVRSTPEFKDFEGRLTS